MPSVNPYSNRDGLYIRASQGGRIATYQVTSEGRRVLENSGLGSGGEISPSDLRTLQAHGLVYTGGGGAGTIDSPVIAPGTSASSATPCHSSYAPTTTTYGSYSETSTRYRLSRYVSVRPRSGGDDWNPAIVFGGGFGLCGIVYALIFHTQVLALLVLLFLPLGVISGFLTKSKERSISEGYWWGQLTGPVGVIVVTFLSDVELPLKLVGTIKNPDVCDDRRVTGTGGDFVRLLGWSIASIVFIALLLALIIVALNWASGTS